MIISISTPTLPVFRVVISRESLKERITNKLTNASNIQSCAIMHSMNIFKRRFGDVKVSEPVNIICKGIV
jgi:hypothetical protein